MWPSCLRCDTLLLFCYCKRYVGINLTLHVVLLVWNLTDCLVQSQWVTKNMKGQKKTITFEVWYLFTLLSFTTTIYLYITSVYVVKLTIRHIIKYETFIRTLHDKQNWKTDTQLEIKSYWTAKGIESWKVINYFSLKLPYPNTFSSENIAINTLLLPTNNKCMNIAHKVGRIYRHSNGGSTRWKYSCIWKQKIRHTSLQQTLLQYLQEIWYLGNKSNANFSATEKLDLKPSKLIGSNNTIAPAGDDLSWYAHCFTKQCIQVFGCKRLIQITEGNFQRKIVFQLKPL